MSYFNGLSNEQGDSSLKQTKTSQNMLKSIFSPKDNSTMHQKQNSRKYSQGTDMFGSTNLGQTTDSYKIDSIDENMFNFQFNHQSSEEEINPDSHQNNADLNFNSYIDNSSMINQKQNLTSKQSIFLKFNQQNYNNNNSQEDIELKKQNLSQFEQYSRRNSKLSNGGMLSPINKMSQASFSSINNRSIITQKNNNNINNLMNLTLNTKLLTEYNERNMKHGQSPKSTKSGLNSLEKEDHRKGMLFKIQQMINEDQIFEDKNSVENNKNQRINLLISQNGLVQKKNNALVRQNTMLQRRAILIEQQKESNSQKSNLDSPKTNHSKTDKGQKEFFPVKQKTSLTELPSINNLSQVQSQYQDGQIQQQISEQPNLNEQKQQKNQLLLRQQTQSNHQLQSLIPSLKNNSISPTQTNNNSKNPIQEDDLIKIYQSQIKKKNLSNFEKVKMKRRQYENKIYSEFEPRLKTFAKFGFKMIEKEENEYLKPFMKEFQTNEPKGTMYVSDLWSDFNIQKFLGNCKMIRDKLILVKLAQKQQSRESLLKKINNSNQLYFSNGSINQANMTEISSIMKKIYIGHQNTNNSQLLSSRDHIQSSRKIDILNRKEELNMINNIHMNELRKTFQKKNEQELLKVFSNHNKERQHSIVLIQQNSLNNRLSKPKLETSISEKMYSQMPKLTPQSSKEEKINQNKLLLNNQNIQQNENVPQNNNNNKFKPLKSQKLNNIEQDQQNQLNFSNRSLTKREDYQISDNNFTKQQTRVLNWIEQIDNVIKDNDKIYDKLNKHIDKLQDVIIKRNDQNQ